MAGMASLGNGECYGVREIMGLVGSFCWVDGLMEITR